MPGVLHVHVVVWCSPILLLCSWKGLCSYAYMLSLILNTLSMDQIDCCSLGTQGMNAQFLLSSIPSCHHVTVLPHVIMGMRLMIWICCVQAFSALVCCTGPPLRVPPSALLLPWTQLVSHERRCCHA